ncbi:hypothetical protein [Pontibacter mucosus]|nr:hypothetical protein [Pontibacter mucosus]
MSHTLYFGYTCLNQDFQDEWMNRSLYFGYTFILASLYFPSRRFP